MFGFLRPITSPSSLLRALSLSFGAAIALGLARFSYALLLPSMKADLGWTFAQAGALNTGNAAGYLAGALVFPWLARRSEAGRVFVFGCVATTLLMALAGCTFDFRLLLAQRFACGLTSAMVFVAGGVLAARLANADARRSGLVLGLYYSGVGWGIVMATLAVPESQGAARHGWQASWLALAALCAMCSALAWPAARTLSINGSVETTREADSAPSRIGAARLLLAAYGLFGIGYIGYMTFVIALLRSAGMSPFAVATFYVVLGLATAASGTLWAGVLDRSRGGGAFAFFCLLLGLATLLPALTASPVAAFASGIVFGATFLSVVTSTTSFVRHNFAPARWSAGISAFTTVFALGQIVGPTVMGAISDGSGLSLAFVCSAAVLLVAAALALGQKPLTPTHA